MQAPDGTMKQIDAKTYNDTERLKDLIKERKELPVGLVYMPVFRVGEICQMKGGWFRIQSFGKRFIKLECITKPGNLIKK